MKKLTCHCGGVEAQINVPDKGFEKIMHFKPQKVRFAYHFAMKFHIKYNFVFWDRCRTGALFSPPGLPF